MRALRLMSPSRAISIRTACLRQRPASLCRVPALSLKPSTVTVLTDAAPLAWDVFARAMETLIALRGPDLLRVKGFLNVEGCRGPVLVQVVQHLAHPPIELAAWPEGERAPRLVFITRNVAETRVRNLFDSVRALAE